MIIKIGGRARATKIVPCYVMISNHSVGKRNPLMQFFKALGKCLSYQRRSDKINPSTIFLESHKIVGKARVTTNYKPLIISVLKSLT